MNKNYERAEKLMRLLDSQFSIFGFRFGLDPIIGLFPVVGDLVSVGLALLIVHTAYVMGVNRQGIIIMILNLTLDFLLGTIPVVGDIGDIVFKANERNMKILRKHYEQQSSIIEGEVVG